MAWSASAVFTQFMYATALAELRSAAVPTGFADLATDVIKAALFDNDITPNKDDTLSNSAYAAGQWVSAGNEVSDGTNWDVGGEPLTNDAVTTGAGFVMYDADNTPQGGASTTLANVFGCLVYDDSTTASPVDQGVCYNYFGGAQSVTAGTFTIVWHANGVFRVTT